jgi:two-component system LytT family sensor kinase
MKLPKPVIILLHALVWGILSFIPLYLVPLVTPSSEFSRIDFSAVLHMGMLIFIFYFNFYFLYPVYFKRKRISVYILLCILMSMLFTTVYALVRHYSGVWHSSLALFIFVKSFISLAVIALSTFCRLMADTITLKRQQRQRETEHLKTELSFLRSQVRPHFMFNVLNSLVALIRQKSDQLEPVVMELSTLMRYMLYESDEAQVSLKTEVDYLLSYVRIQLIRFSEDVDVTLDIQRDLPDKLIEPMLLIPIVENAFKHGIGMIEQPAIHIKLWYANDALGLTVRNKFTAAYPSRGEKRNSGIGLENLKKRLTLLYPDHTLSIDKNGAWFIVSLRLKIKAFIERETEILTT